MVIHYVNTRARRVCMCVYPQDGLLTVSGSAANGAGKWFLKALSSFIATLPVALRGICLGWAGGLPPSGEVPAVGLGFSPKYIPLPINFNITWSFCF